MFLNKKIVVVATEFFAVDYFLGPVINKISQKNQIYILANNISNNTRKLNLNTNINIINFNIVRKPNFFNDLFSLIFLFKFFFNNKNFVVLSITPKALFLVSLCKFLSFKSFKNINFITGQIWTNKNYFIKKLFKIIDHFVFKLASYNLVDSKSQIQYLVSEGYNKKQFNLIHNGSICGVNLNLFNINKHLLNNDFINIIFVGRLNREKGLFLLIDEFLNLKKNINLFG